MTTRRTQGNRAAARDPEFQNELERVLRELAQESPSRRQAYQEALRFREEMQPLDLAVDELLQQAREDRTS